MSEKKSPLYKKQVECPVCRNYTDNFVLKSKIVVPAKLDSDNYVLKYNWLSSSYKKCLPSFYALWVCSTCGFADFPENFSTFLHEASPDFLALKNAVLKSTSSKEGVLFKLVDAIDVTGDELSFESAMNIHLLAIYCNDVLHPENTDYEKLGRLYLRNAWLFRDYAQLNKTPSAFAGYDGYFSYLRSLKDIWPEIPVKEEDSLRKAAFYYNNLIESDFSFEEAVKNIKEIFFSAELYLKLNDYSKAVEIVDLVIRHGMDSRRMIQDFISERKKDKALPQQEELYLRAKMRKISDHLLQVKDKMSDIDRMWAASYDDVVSEVINTYGEHDPEVIFEKLRAEDVPEKVITYLKENDSRFRKKDEGDGKKKAWQFWK